MAYQSTGSLFSGFGAVSANLPLDVQEYAGEDMQGAGFRRETPSAAPRALPPMLKGSGYAEPRAPKQIPVNAPREMLGSGKYTEKAAKIKHEFADPDSDFRRAAAIVKRGLQSSGREAFVDFGDAMETLGLGYGPMRRRRSYGGSAFGRWAAEQYAPGLEKKMKFVQPLERKKLGTGRPLHGGGMRQDLQELGRSAEDMYRTGRAVTRKDLLDAMDAFRRASGRR